MWSLQDEDGGWSAWLQCGWPPFESDDHFGVTLAAVTAGILPQSYRESAAAAAGIQRLRGWLRDHPPQNLHHKGMMLWAASGLDGDLDGVLDGVLDRLVDDETRQKWSRELLAANGPTAAGAWSMWGRGNGNGLKMSPTSCPAMPTPRHFPSLYFARQKSLSTIHNCNEVSSGCARASARVAAGLSDHPSVTASITSATLRRCSPSWRSTAAANRSDHLLTELVTGWSEAS